MCCSVSPDVEVRFSDKILYAAEIVNPQDKTVHVLGYQNRAQNNVSRLNSTDYPPFKPTGFWNKLRNYFDSSESEVPTIEETTGNAMILPFPATPRTMSKENVLDTERCPDILKDIAKAVKPPPDRSIPSPVSFGSQQSVQIFEAAGIYTVVLAQDARAIPDSLSQVPKEKRPKLNPALFDAYAKWYPDWTIALCCFNNDEAQEALPMLWWYEPMNPEKLFLPALDCHTGNVPNLNAEVKVEHSVAVGSSLAEQNLTAADENTIKCSQCGAAFPNNFPSCLLCNIPLQKVEIPQKHYRRVYYKDKDFVPPQIKPYLLPKVMGGIFNLIMPNGDFVCQIEEVRKGIWNPVRTLPPDAN